MALVGSAPRPSASSFMAQSRTRRSCEVGRLLGQADLMGDLQGRRPGVTRAPEPFRAPRVAERFVVVTRLDVCFCAAVREDDVQRRVHIERWAAEELERGCADFGLVGLRTRRGSAGREAFGAEPFELMTRLR